jgi:hypothetical protein
MSDNDIDDSETEIEWSAAAGAYYPCPSWRLRCIEADERFQNRLLDATLPTLSQHCRRINFRVYAAFIRAVAQNFAGRPALIASCRTRHLCQINHHGVRRAISDVV